MHRLQLLGRLGRDPEVRQTPVGLVASFSVATHEYSKDRETGEGLVHTEWHELVCFDQLARVAQDALRKGIEIFAEGRIRTNKWTGSDGKVRTDREMRVDVLRILREPRSDELNVAVAQLDGIALLAREMQAGTRVDATMDDIADMLASVREILTEGK